VLLQLELLIPWGTEKVVEARRVSLEWLDEVNHPGLVSWARIRIGLLGHFILNNEYAVNNQKCTLNN